MVGMGGGDVEAITARNHVGEGAFFISI